ncbi:MAG: nucleotidyltransferase domain-containing protein [Deltaproteobacteria bacterium]|nr:MAG: nucleotidyltransferase domain-containing protein [Deltaproteobacteria bacterium]
MMKTIRKVRAKDDSVLAAIKERLYAVLSENAKEIILFGSRAREDAQRDSDYDILLLVDKRSRLLENKVDGIAYEMLERYGVVVTIFVDEVKAFQMDQSEPLFCNICQEGAVL